MTEFSQRLAQTLAARNDTLFGVPGGGPNLDLVGAATAAGMRFVLAHGETSAAIMASTYGLLTAAPVGLVVTRGPGAASAINGSAQATLDRFPLVVVTDTVTAAQAPRVSHQRIDQRALFAPVTVASATAGQHLSDDELGDLVDRAALWPCGAVHLDYDPSAPAPPQSPEPSAGRPAANPAVGDDLEPAVELVRGSRRPLIVVGMEAAWIDHQAQAVGDHGPLGAILDEVACPVLTTYQAIGLVPTEGWLNAGLYTNGALEQPAFDEADLIVMIGVDTVEPIPTPWAQTVPVITVSSGDAIDEFIPADVDLVGDVPTLAHQLFSAARHQGWSHDWHNDDPARLREEARSRLRPTPSAVFGPVDLVGAALDAATNRSTSRSDGLGLTVTVDAGAHFLSVMPFWPVSRPFELLISNGLATMGFSLPAAIGAALARPDQPVLAFCGDGGLAMTLGELETIVRLRLPITIVVFNDAALSLIAVKQQPEHGGESAIRYRTTEFATIAEASGLDGNVARSADELRELVAAGWGRPRLIDARIDPADYGHLISITRG